MSLTMSEHAAECDCACTRCHDRGCRKCDPAEAADYAPWDDEEEAR